MGLSPRELQVLKLIAEGKTIGQIALRLGVSEPTVKEHASRIRSKLGARNAPQAVHLAYQCGVLKIGEWGGLA